MPIHFTQYKTLSALGDDSCLGIGVRTPARKVCAGLVSQSSKDR